MMAGGGAGPAGPHGPPGGHGARHPNLSTMIERMPAATAAELKPGDTVIISSTVGRKPEELTAIVLLANAEPILHILSAVANRHGRSADAGAFHRQFPRPRARWADGRPHDSITKTCGAATTALAAQENNDAPSVRSSSVDFHVCSGRGTSRPAARPARACQRSFGRGDSRCGDSPEACRRQGNPAPGFAARTTSSASRDSPRDSLAPITSSCHHGHDRSAAA